MIQTIRAQAFIQHLLSLLGLHSAQLKVDLLKRLRAIVAALIRFSARSRQRQHLSSLDDRALRDIGITRLDALAEAAKPFWKP